MRHDCPADLEDEEAVTEVISIVGSAPHEGEGGGGSGDDDEPEFDDGSFFTFVPEERHRFRLSTPSPRKPNREGTKKPNKKFFISTTTARQTSDRRVPFVVAGAGEEDAVVQRPRLLQDRPKCQLLCVPINNHASVTSCTVDQLQVCRARAVTLAHPQELQIRNSKT